jgi:MFS family permease
LIVISRSASAAFCCASICACALLSANLATILAFLTQLRLVRVWQVIVFSFLTGVTQAISWPVYQAVLAELVGREDLSNDIALNSAQFNMARAIGPVLGAMGLSALGTAGCFYANAISFLAVVAALAKIHISPMHLAGGLPKSGFLGPMKEGFRYIRTTGPLFWLLSTLAATSVLGVPLVTLLPVFARDVLKIGAQGLGWLVGSFGLGAVTGGFVVAYRADFRRKGNYVMIAVLSYVAAMIAFALSRLLVLSLFCLAAAGFAMVGYASVINTIVQKAVPDHLRGRAMSMFVFSFGGCMPLGNLLAGWMANRIGAPLAVLLQGAVLGLYALALYVVRPHIRELT